MRRPKELNGDQRGVDGLFWGIADFDLRRPNPDPRRVLDVMRVKDE